MILNKRRHFYLISTNGAEATGPTDEAKAAEVWPGCRALSVAAVFVKFHMQFRVDSNVHEPPTAARTPPPPLPPFNVLSTNPIAAILPTLHGTPGIGHFGRAYRRWYQEAGEGRRGCGRRYGNDRRGNR